MQVPAQHNAGYIHCGESATYLEAAAEIKAAPAQYGAYLAEHMQQPIVPYKHSSSLPQHALQKLSAHWRGASKQFNPHLQQAPAHSPVALPQSAGQSSVALRQVANLSLHFFSTFLSAFDGVGGGGGGWAYSMSDGICGC